MYISLFPDNNILLCLNGIAAPPPLNPVCMPSAAQCEYVSAVEAASKLSPVVDARISGERLTKGGPHTLLSSGVWFYHCSLRPYLVKALAVAMAVVSAAVIWSEGTLGLGWNKTSPFAAVRLSPR